MDAVFRQHDMFENATLVPRHAALSFSSIEQRRRSWRFSCAVQALDWRPAPSRHAAPAWRRPWFPARYLPRRLASGDPHDMDGVADHVGGRFSPLGPRGIGGLFFPRKFLKNRSIALDCRILMNSASIPSSYLTRTLRWFAQPLRTMETMPRSRRWPAVRRKEGTMWPMRISRNGSMKSFSPS